MGNKLLVTAFEPFGGRKKNASAEVLKNLQEAYDLDTLILPVEFKDFKEIEDIKRLAPDYILCMGESGRQTVDLETKAKNMTSYSSKIDEKDKPFYLSTLPNKKIIEHLKRQGYEIRWSEDAGLYVCNFTFYKISKAFSESKTNSGFLHLPREGNTDKLTDIANLITEFLQEEKS